MELRIRHRCKPDIDFRIPNEFPVLSIWQFWNDDSIDRVGTRRMIAYETEFDLLTISPLQRNDDFGKKILEIVLPVNRACKTDADRTFMPMVSERFHCRLLKPAA